MKRVLVIIVFLASAPALGAGGDAAAGKTLYLNACQSCHGANGKGDGPAMAEAYLTPRDFAKAAFKFDTNADWQRGTDADLADVIRHGPQAYGGSYLMPPWPDLSDEEIANLVAFIRSLAE